jgi:muramidase (phage lysozyme)
MKNLAIISAGGLLAYAAYVVSTTNQGQIIDLTPSQPTAPGTAIFNNAATFIDGLTMGLFNLSNMKLAKREMLNIPNVRAMLAVIRKGEGTSDSAGYGRIFGGQMFTDFSKHPNIKVTKSGYTSTAAGAYQFLFSTWKETASAMGLSDFSPSNQDLGALGRIAARGALDDVINGRFYLAIQKMGKEWASLPGSPYGQPVQTIAGAQQVYIANNGTITA